MNVPIIQGINTHYIKENSETESSMPQKSETEMVPEFSAYGLRLRASGLGPQRSETEIVPEWRSKDRSANTSRTAASAAQHEAYHI